LSAFDFVDNPTKNHKDEKTHHFVYPKLSLCSLLLALGAFFSSGNQ
jgi:hypothetical protein